MPAVYLTITEGLDDKVRELQRLSNRKSKIDVVINVLENNIDQEIKEWKKKTKPKKDYHHQW